MYQVNIGDKIIYYPGSDDATIFDTELNEEVGLAGEFKFKVPPTNPQYSLLTTGALVTILKDKKEFWRGEIRDVRYDFMKVADVYVLEDIAWLKDEYAAPVKITNQTYAQRLNAAITTYNANRPSERRFETGNITNVTSSANCNWTTEYEWSLLDSIRNCICKDTGYIKIRRQYESGVLHRYVDVVRLEDYGVMANQAIEYGYNLLDYVKESDYGNLTNVLTPYGDEKDDDSEVYEDYSERIQGTTISNTDSINVYGRHAKAVVFDNVSTVAQLNALAQSYLTRYCQPQLTMEVQAIDLSMVEDVDEIKIGDSVRVIAKPFAVDQSLFLTQIRRDIQNPDKNTLTLSGQVVRRTLTSQVIATIEAVEELPEESSILKAARRNALNLLLDETQSGYVVYEYDANNKYIVAINICNGKTIELSTKRWRWSQTGFGYMERNSTSAAWSGAEAKIAITMNGEIVATYITTGTMLADRMRGGELGLGGGSNGAYKNGVLKIYDSNDQLIGKWTKDGIDIDVGDINLGNGNFHVTNAGAMTAKSGYIGNGSSGWHIGNTSIYNGCNGVDTDAAGTYVGTDGYRNQSGTGNNKKYTQIKNGKITSNDADIKGKIEATSGKIGGFTIEGDDLQVGDAKLSRYHIGCGYAGKGIVNICGNNSSGDEKYGYIQISNSGSHDVCLDGIRIYGNGIVERYDGDGDRTYRKDLANIPDG